VNDGTNRSQQEYRRTLGYSVAVAGGIEPLASRLRVSSSKVEVWTAGLEHIPDAIYLAIVDVICGASDAELQRARRYRASFQRKDTKAAGGAAR